MVTIYNFVRLHENNVKPNQMLSTFTVFEDCLEKLFGLTLLLYSYLFFSYYVSLKEISVDFTFEIFDVLKSFAMKRKLVPNNKER